MQGLVEADLQMYTIKKDLTKLAQRPRFKQIWPFFSFAQWKFPTLALLI